MNVKISDLMVEKVVTAQPHHTVEHVRAILGRNTINAVPIVGPEGEALGIVTAGDLAADLKPGAPIQGVMTDRVYSVPRYDDVHVAARIMRKRRIHHLVVTHEQKVVGIVSAFDLLKLVEDRRFTMKSGPTPSKRRGSKRA